MPYQILPVPRRPALARRFVDCMPKGDNSGKSACLIESINPNRQAMRHIEPEIADNRAVFPDAATLSRLAMMRDLARKRRRVLNRVWTEIKLR